MLVNNTDDEEGPTSTAGLEAQETFADKAEAHRTPAKRKAEDVDASWMHNSPYKRQLVDDVVEEESPLSQESKEVLRVLDESGPGPGEDKHDFVESIRRDQGHCPRSQRDVKVLGNTSWISWLEGGVEPSALSADYDAPLVWGSIKAMGAHLDTMAVLAKRKPMAVLAKRKPYRNLAEEVVKFTDPFKELLVDMMADRAVTLDERINTLKSFMLRSTKKMNEKIDIEIIGWTPE
jgi:hypothetical protein